MNDTIRKGAAELIGTFGLVFIGAGSICTDQYLISRGEAGIGLMGVALAHGLVLAVMVSSVGHISGGHINPAVTVGALVSGRMGLKEGVTYIASQLLGAILGALLLAGIFSREVWQAVSLGTPDLADGVTSGTAILLEGILTFFLVFTVFATAIDGRGAFKMIAGFGIGLVLVFDILVGGPLTGASMNPARTLGPALVGGHWQNHLVYWIGPLAGGAVAASVYSTLFLREKSSA
ncbi:MAG: MIP family channel protein [Fidelibacterota bacterium]